MPTPNQDTPRQRVLDALAGRSVSPLPFTIYDNLAPRTTGERLLRNRGMCLLQRRSVLTMHRPNVKTTTRPIVVDGKAMVETAYETPVGQLTMRQQPNAGTTWTVEHLFKTPDDYKTLAFLYADEVYVENYQSFVAAEQRAGGDSLFRTYLGREPLQELIAGPAMGTAAFCMEWMENQDEVLKLYEVIVENRRKQYPLVANSPATHANYGGNITPDILGPKVFENYYMPHYAEAAEHFHAAGKLLGCHFDDNCGILRDLIAQTPLDYIEAFTPAPDTDMTLADARAAWPSKVLWLNFPSSVHMREPEEVKQTTLELLDMAGSYENLIMGVTEDIPLDRWEASCHAILDGLETHAHSAPAAV